MIGLNVMRISVKHVWPGATIVATVLLVAGCEFPGAEQPAPPATPTPAARAVPTPAPTPSPTASYTVEKEWTTPCTQGSATRPMRAYANTDVVRWTADGAQILLAYNAEVWTVTSDGTGLWRLAQAWGQQEPGDSIPFGWMTSFDVSPDGMQVVYATCRYPPDLPRAAILGDYGRWTFDFELAVVDLDGQAPRRLTRHPAFENYPAWSPDGTRVAFLSNRHRYAPRSEQYERVGLYTMAADGADVRLLVNNSGSVAWQPPAWSPDGRSIAVAAWPQGEAGHGLYVVHADGARVLQLAEARLADAVSGGSWSPDGTRLAFVKLDGPRVALFTIAADGSNARRVTTVPYWLTSYGTQAWVHTVAWSPDGSKFLYSCGPRQFCAVTLDGDLVGEVPLVGDHAAWSPDGGRIAVVVALQDRDERIVLYSAAPDGSDVKPLALRGEVAGEGLVAAQSAEEDLAKSRAACTAGFVVPAPDTNPGLVRDCDTLLAARAALFGELLVNWGSGTPLENWQGVTVAGSPPRVTGLDLRYSERGWDTRREVFQERLIGTIPPELGTLDHLQALDLSYNGLAGPIPPELGALDQLTELSLRGNRLTGPIPEELGQLTSLTVLDLSHNELTGEIPRALNILQDLEQFYLANNDLKVCIPFSLKPVPDNDLGHLEWTVCKPAS